MRINEYRYLAGVIVGKLGIGFGQRYDNKTGEQLEGGTKSKS